MELSTVNEVNPISKSVKLAVRVIVFDKSELVEYPHTSPLKSPIP